jgi:hypothetical protein
VLTSFLLPLLQTAPIITTITVTRNVIAPLARTIATANEVIVGIGTEKGTVAGEKETTASDTPTENGNAQTAAATGTANVAAIVKKDARATRKNADETTRAKTSDAAHTAARKREAPRAAAASAVAGAVNVMAVHKTADRLHLLALSRSRSVSARPAVGTFMHRAMSNTRLCKRSKQVRIALVEFVIRC